MGAMGWARVCHPSILRMVVWPEASRAQRSIGTVLRAGQHGLGFDPAAERLVQPPGGVGGPRRFPLRRGASGRGG